MAQWMGQFSGHTHLSKVEDREQQLRHAVEVWRSKEPMEVRQAYSKTVIRFAERLLNARIRTAKAQIAALDPRDDRKRELLEEKIARIIESGTAAILDEFGAKDMVLTDSDP